MALMTRSHRHIGIRNKRPSDVFIINNKTAKTAGGHTL